MATYCSASILPSTSLKTPTPFHPIHPQTISEPPPNLTVPLTSLEISPSPFFFHTYSCPSDPILLILVSSDHITLLQSSTVQCWYLRAKANLFFLWPVESNGFFFFTTAFNEASLRVFLTVWEETGLSTIELMKWVAWTAFLALPVRICWTIALLLVEESLEGQPPWSLGLSGWISWRTWDTVDFPRPVCEAIFLVDRPREAREMMFCLWEVEMDFMVMMRKWAEGGGVYICWIILIT